MKLVTVATKSEKYYPYLKLSAERYGHELITLGWGQKWKGFSWRFQLITEYLKTCKEDELICIIDGYDVLVLEGPKEIEEKFNKICNGNKSKVIISKNTYTDNIISKITILMGDYLSFKEVDGYFLCAGTYIGRASEILKMYSIICKRNECYDNTDDQVLLQKYALENKGSYIIDKNNEIFLVLADPFNGIVNRESNIEINNESLYYKNTKISILHAPVNTDIDNIILNLGYDTSLYRADMSDRYNYIWNSFIHFIPMFFFNNILFIFMFSCKVINLKTINVLRQRIDLYK
jgi:hypothetical protein